MATTNAWTGSPAAARAAALSPGRNTDVSIPCGTYKGFRPASRSACSPNRDIAIGMAPITPNQPDTTSGTWRWSTGTHEPTHSWSSNGDSNVHTSPRVRMMPLVEASSTLRHFSAWKWWRAWGTITSLPYGAEYDG